MNQVHETPALRLKRALYRASHRGTKEMDWMIGRYAAARLDAMTAAELQTFEAFLEGADPDLNAWLLNPALCPEPAFAELVHDIRVYHALAEHCDRRSGCKD